MTPLAYGLLFVVTLLSGSFAYTLLCLPKASPSRGEILLRIKTWCWILLFLLPVFLAPTPWALAVLGLISFVAFKEFITLTPSRTEDRWALMWAYLAIPFQYLWAGMAWYGMFIIFIPVYIFLLVPTRLVLSGRPDGFLRSTTTLHWGLMTTVFSLSHMGYLLALTGQTVQGIPVEGTHLLFFLLFLTQINDVSQFVWGKTLGNRKILPLISPKKTWGGFLGGVGTTTVISVCLAPWFTPLNVWLSLFIGLVVSVSGFLGDVVMSAIKRDIGIKDTGTLLPGHGGILDRLDSLTFTAPLFFHTLYYFYF